MRISKVEAISIMHSHLYNPAPYFQPDVLGIIHNQFYPEIEDDNLMGLLSSIRKKGLLPYDAGDGLLYVGVLTPYSRKIKTIPSVDSREVIAVPLSRTKFEALLKRLEFVYCT